MNRPNPLLRLFFINWTLGVGLGCAFATLFLVADIGGLRSLLMRSDMLIAGIALLYVGFSVTCGGVVCASAVMRVPREEQPPQLGHPLVSEANLIEATQAVRRN